MNVEARPSEAKAFFADKYADAAKRALKFAGKDGRLATVPDIIDARLETPLGQAPWEVYFSTNSAEYFGFSKGKNPIMIVAHGVGPMATPDGTIMAYASSLVTRDGHGGRISQEDFLKLESGQFGDVEVIDYADYIRRYRYPFMDSLRVWDAANDPLVKARLGTRYIEYLNRHFNEALYSAIGENQRRKRGEVVKFGMTITRQITGEDTKIIQVSDPNNSSYKFRTSDKPPLAHSLGIGQLMYMNGDSLHTEIYCREYPDPARLVGVKGKGPIKDIKAQIPSLAAA